MRIMAAQAQVEGNDPAIYDLAAAELAVRREGYEAGNAAYEAWSGSTAGTRDIAEKAQAELERRGHKVPAWAPEDEHSEPRADEPERQAEAEPERKAEPEASPEAAGRHRAGPGLSPSSRSLAWSRCTSSPVTGWTCYSPQPVTGMP